MSTRRRKNLKRLLTPRHVAFIGGKAMESAIRNCLEAGFAGDVWTVNPNYDQLGGQPCVATVADLPEAPDAAFVAVPREATVDVVRQLATLGAGGAVCYAAGFAEVGGKGAALQGELVAAAGDLALVGPNCHGILNYIDGVAMWPITPGVRRIERGVAIVGQSGNLGINVTKNQRSVPIAYVVTTGNQAVLDLGDYIDALLDVAGVTAIGLYIEAIADVAGFSRAALRALEKGVPIVALKAGSSEIGARFALTHTASLAGADEVYQALFDRLAISRVDTPAALLETLKMLSVTGPLAGRRLAVFTCSGGEAAMVADVAVRTGIDLPQPSPAQHQTLRPLLPDYATVANPLDYNTALWGDRDGLEPVFTTLMNHDAYDAAMLVIDYQLSDVENAKVDAAVDALIAAARHTGMQTLMTSMLPESIPGPARERMIAAGIAPLQAYDYALAAAAAAAAFGERRQELEATDDPESALVPPAGPEPRNPRVLDEYESKQRLSTFGVTVPPGRCADAARAPGAAREVGFPVAVKVLDAGLTHKSDAGAVRLGLASADAVAAAVADMRATVTAHHPECRADRFLVEPMIADAVCELIVGVKHDPRFGFVLVVGAGGVLVETMGDARTLLLPIRRGGVARAIASLKCARLLDGHRGRPAGDVDAAIEAVLAVARFAEAHRGRLAELDVNPLMVRPEGRGAVAADALVRMSID
jgi:acyl-CoA synthetase (NDP forming)